MAFMNTVQILTGESLDEAHWPICVAVIRVFFGLWQIKLEESTKFLREGYLANQLEKAVIHVQLIDVLSVVSPAPSGVDEGSSDYQRREYVRFTEPDESAGSGSISGRKLQGMGG
jgi:hypothetical protein